MVTITFGDIACRTAPSRTVQRRFLARLIVSTEGQLRRTAIAARLGFDDGRLATFGYGRKSVDLAGRGPFPL
jgi:hypothetical protein